ncbi:hypothetical protein CQA44_03530 [Helicobacter sp. MIT 14-3879]|nr:hypothetical protein CQA44_03530 [Helicobacter sp. MIT 14-3879]
MIYHHLSKVLLIIFCNAGLSTTYLPALDFRKCQEFYLNTSKEFIESRNLEDKYSSDIQTIRAIHIGNGKYLAYTNKNFNHPKIIKYDYLTGLILFSDKLLNQKYTLREVDKTIKVSAINDSSITTGSIQQRQNSLVNLAIFSKEIKQNSVISDICYQAYGISAKNNKFIDKKYIELFLNKNGMYSDIGIKLNANLRIENINPFIGNAIKINDILLSINGVDIKNINDFIDISSNLNTSKNALLKIKRGNDIISVIIKPFKRLTPFIENDSYLEIFGIMLDNKLVVRSKVNKFNFKQNDRILRLNQIKVRNKSELDSAILQTFRENEKEFSFLVIRDDFEFFITLER